MPEKETAAPWKLPYPTSVGEVKLGAEDFKELAERTTVIFGEKLLIQKSYAGSATLKSGEWAGQGKTGETLTLPVSAPANQIIGVYMGVTGAAKITTSGGNVIFGDFISPTATISLGQYQHVVLQSDGVASWIIIAGEPRNENVYGAFAAVTKGVVQTPNANRPVDAIVKILQGNAGGGGVVTLPGAVTVDVPCATRSGGTNIGTIGFSVPAAGTWSWSGEFGAEPAKSAEVSYRIR